MSAKPKRKVASLARIAQAEEIVETCQTYSERFAEMRARAEPCRKSDDESGATSRRRPRRAGATDLAKFDEVEKF